MSLRKNKQAAQSYRAAEALHAASLRPTRHLDAHLVEMVNKFASEDKHVLCADGQVLMSMYSVCTSTYMVHTLNYQYIPGMYLYVPCMY